VKVSKLRNGQSGRGVVSVVLMAMPHRSLNLGITPDIASLLKLRCSDAVGRLIGALDHVLPWRVRFGFALS
jgi:hypothetical protein